MLGGLVDHMEYSKKIRIYGLRLSVVRFVSKACVQFYKFTGHHYYSFLKKVFSAEQNLLTLRLQHLIKPIVNEYQDCVKDSNSEKEYIPRVAWVCWFQGYNQAPELVQICKQSIEINSGINDIRLLDFQNIESFITIPESIKAALDQGNMSYALFSDYVRVAILAQYGGIWFDATCFCIKPVPKSIFSTQRYSPKDIRPFKFGGMPSFIFPYLNEWTSYLIGSRKNDLHYCFMQTAFEYYFSKYDVSIDYYFVFYLAKIARVNLKSTEDHSEFNVSDNSWIESLAEWFRGGMKDSFDPQEHPDTWCYKLSYKSFDKMQGQILKKWLQDSSAGQFHGGKK
ncbi:capsular polysaccharide synthesis protein [Levilactobacillus brevis]|uniref:capsular polysaccharide synthesis protein n=2 Tax=Levilactobacillus brevis TaxID=1580 RepID=UPI001F1841B9|nr:capsular polysaccharide synthesis protein [Levilactobacillus brevis]MCE6039032.1 capsular polysaccharide synthesis protein [Levilactobacillus brevis]